LRTSLVTNATKPIGQSNPCFSDRAMWLWPRLDRARIRRIANDPESIARLIENRTSQPYEVILAMLTREVPEASSSTHARPQAMAAEERRGETIDKLSNPRLLLRKTGTD
jgi:hypothetical protein